MESIRKSKFSCFNNFHYDNELANNIRPSWAQVIIINVHYSSNVYIHRNIYISIDLFIFLQGSGILFSSSFITYTSVFSSQSL